MGSSTGLVSSSHPLPQQNQDQRPSRSRGIFHNALSLSLSTLFVHTILLTSNDNCVGSAGFDPKSPYIPCITSTESLYYGL